jgi:hypothetical protein
VNRGNSRDNSISSSDSSSSDSNNGDSNSYDGNSSYKSSSGRDIPRRSPVAAGRRVEQLVLHDDALAQVLHAALEQLGTLLQWPRVVVARHAQHDGAEDATAQQVVAHDHLPARAVRRALLRRRVDAPVLAVRDSKAPHRARDGRDGCEPHLECGQRQRRVAGSCNTVASAGASTGRRAAAATGSRRQGCDIATLTCCRSGCGGRTCARD